jgi:hypothetical protein
MRAMREQLPIPAVSVGNRAPAVLSQAGAPLSWTSERADTLFVCERVRKAAACERQLPRAERAMDREGSRDVLSSASDDEVGGTMRAMREQLPIKSAALSSPCR